MSLTYPESRIRAELISDVHTVVHLDLTGSDSAVVTTTVDFACAESGATSFLELASALEVTVLTDGAASARVEDGRIQLSELSGPGTRNVVTVVARMPYVGDGDGITSVVDAADGERYVCTYTAMDVAQRVLPCFDQPDIKSTFEVSVSAAGHWTVLANGLLTHRDADVWHFAATPPIASYLFFVAAGPWVSQTWDEPYPAAPGGTLPFGWHARASQAPALEREATWLRELTSAAFAWYTTHFTEPYPFADYQQVFTPGLNWGAMEFPGVVAFRDEYLTPGEPTAIARQQLASVVCHEMAHMWFGDLVTMQWWEDSWLNESFADYMGYRVSGEIGFSTGWTMSTLTRKPTAYRADSRRSTHPIAEDAENLVDVDTAFANFDMITYAKGAAVLHQLVSWLGFDDFLAGVNAHLGAHRFANATLADFLDALDAATDRDVRGWAQAWLRTTGYDTIALTQRPDGTPVLDRTGHRPHRFTVAGFDATGSLVHQAVVDLADEPVPLTEFTGLVVLPNAENEAYAALDMSAAAWAEVLGLVDQMESPQHRAMVWATACERVHDGATSATELARQATRSLAFESDPTVFEGAVALLLGVVTSYSPPGAALEAAVQELAQLARQVVARGPASHQGAAARLLAATGTDAALLASWLKADQGLLADDQELRWLVVRRLAELGRTDFIAAEAERDPSTAGTYAALAARAARPSLESKHEAWGLACSGTLTNRQFSAVVAGFWGREQGDLVAEWAARAPGDLAELARSSGQGMGQLIGRALPAIPLPTPIVEEVSAGIEAALAAGVPTVAARQFNDRLDDLRRVLRNRVTR